MKPYVIVNPVAGSIVDLNVVLRQLRRLNAKEVRVTQRPGEAETLAREAVRAGSSYTIAAGGGGTLGSHQQSRRHIAVPGSAWELYPPALQMILRGQFGLTSEMDITSILASKKTAPVDLGRMTADTATS